MKTQVCRPLLKKTPNPRHTAHNITGATATQRPHLAEPLWRCDRPVEGGDVPVTIDRHSTHRAAQRPIGFADVTTSEVDSFRSSLTASMAFARSSGIFGAE